MIRQRSAAQFLATTRRDVLRIVPTIRPCSLAPFKWQAYEFSTFAIFPIPRRLLTGSQAPCGRLSFRDHCYGTRTLIERWIGGLVTHASTCAFSTTEKTTETAAEIAGRSWRFGSSVLIMVFRS